MKNQVLSFSLPFKVKNQNSKYKKMPEKKMRLVRIFLNIPFFKITFLTPKILITASFDGILKFKLFGSTGVTFREVVYKSFLN